MILPRPEESPRRARNERATHCERSLMQLENSIADRTRHIQLSMSVKAWRRENRATTHLPLPILHHRITAPRQPTQRSALSAAARSRGPAGPARSKSRPREAAHRKVAVVEARGWRRLIGTAPTGCASDRPSRPGPARGACRGVPCGLPGHGALWEGLCRGGGGGGGR